MPRGKRHSKPARKKIRPQCSALTRSYDACKNRATSSRARQGLPVCWSHRKLGLSVAFCQAPLGGSRKCLKKIPWTEIQLCFKHIELALPCYILRLPLELRQQIFSYILNEYQSSYAKFYTYYSFLKVARLNRQIFEDATDVLYRKLVCDIFLSGKDVYILGRKCHSIQTGSWQRFKQLTFQLNISVDHSGRHGPILENVQLIASHLQGSNLIKLHICLDSVWFWYTRRRSVELIRNFLPSYLDPFRQLGRVRELSVALSPKMSGRSNEIELWMEDMSNDSEAMAMAMEWKRYYEEWTKNLKRECLEKGVGKCFEF
ncbi:hypothetical protein BDBG_06816 [Blastomyces gilchristii SLH14081]|uniref:Uncharacterized protein n=1 Tax=Blastomyces gilchristii (strain SLH14081) TaxID=559298 RepID=A0A179UT68_BLAGS|nr:uncharacterized protein BDBG_06816 [Blastomyces gilchristii SLH14081]OAT11296.1 hypothetical protein BDBG_06816 [Blastomyces gilchristii SLH14081]